MINNINFSFSSKDDNEQHKEVYAYFGSAVYYAQVLEHQLTNMLVLIRVAKKSEVSITDIDNLFSKYFSNTMGNLIHELKETYKLSESELKELKEILKLRNYIIHDYFKKKIWLTVK